MRLAKLSEFRSLVYTPGSAPALETLRSRVDRGLIPGGTKQHGRYYVDLDAFDDHTGARRSLEAHVAKLRSDPRLARLI